QAGVYTGGSQDNGTVVNTASSGTVWGLTWGGDGGNTAIDPNNPKNYFTENAYLPTPPSSEGQNPIILVSTNGGAPVNKTFSSSYPACGWPGNGNITQEEQTLYNCDPTYSPILDTNLISENGDFYLPYKLIPNDTSEMLLATCRLWMGPAIPAKADQGWVPVSPDLTSDGAPAGACGGDYIQDFAATPDDVSEIYTVTTDGQVQVSSSAFGPQPVLWKNVTVSPLPTNGSLPFGAIAVDPANAQVAYLGVQGFIAGTDYGHVYMTSNGGASWTDITGNLPDSPVNAIAIDPEIPNDIYIGTDVGVFAATDGGVSGENWQQMGSGLPASAVLDLKIDDATRLLVAATHGRGAWAIPLLGTPQSGFTLTTPDAIVYPASSAGKVQVTIGAVAQAGFSQPIMLSCDGCTATTVNPGSSVTLTVTESTSGEQIIPFTGSGGGVTQTISVTSIPAAFSLNATPSDPTVTAGQSATLTASISPQGPFTGPVSLSCPGSGDGITCTVSPASVQITSGTAATATVTITTTAAGAMPALPPANDGPSRGWLIAALLALALLAAASWNRLQPGARGLKPVAARRAVWLAPLLLAAMFLAMSACGSGSSAGLPPTSGGGGGGGGGSATATPTGAYSITLQAASGSTTQTFPVVLSVQ
ncbi:MAG: WD40/YVTN/BNR-like repeat-containing protein, partial [Terriglobales bacterium]